MKLSKTLTILAASAISMPAFADVVTHTNAGEVAILSVDGLATKKAEEGSYRGLLDVSVQVSRCEGDILTSRITEVETSARTGLKTATYELSVEVVRNSDDLSLVCERGFQIRKLEIPVVIQASSEANTTQTFTYRVKTLSREGKEGVSSVTYSLDKNGWSSKGVKRN